MGYHKTKMRAFQSALFTVAAAFWVTPSVESFSVTPLLLTPSTCTSTRHPAATATSIALNAQTETSSRRSFVNSASCVMISAATATAVGISSAAPVWAVDDLAMPTAEEQKKMDDVRTKCSICMPLHSQMQNPCTRLIANDLQ